MLARVRRSAATIVAARGLRSGAMTVRTHQDPRVTARVPVSAGVVRRGVATGLRTHRGVAIGHPTHAEEAIGLRTQVAAAMTAPVRHFGATTAEDGRRFVETTGRTRRARLEILRVEGRSTVMGRREAATGLRMQAEAARHEEETGHRMQAEAARHEEEIGLHTHHGAAVQGRSPLDHAALGPAGHAETTIRVPSGIPVTRSRVAGAGHRSGQDHPGAEEAAAPVVGRGPVAGRALLMADHRVASAPRSGTEPPAVTRDPRARRRIGVEEPGARHEDEADRADRRATRRDGLVAGRDL